jgi:hypothetical protein
MEKTSLQTGLGSLNESVRKIHSLLAWIELKQEEHARRDRMQFQLYDCARDDLRSECANFLHTCSQVREALKTSPGTPEPERERISKWLARTETWIQGLDSRSAYPGSL